MGRPIKHGSTDQSTVIRIIDAIDGTPETGVTAATSGLDLKYRREGAAPVSLTESTLASADAAHSDGGLIHLFAGYYRVDLPDAAFASGSPGVLVGGTCTGMVVIGNEHPLVANVAADVYARLGAPVGASTAEDLAGIKSILDAILNDTGTTLDGKINNVTTLINAVKAKTDSLTFQLPGKVDANMTHVNEIAVTGSGTEGDPWGPA